MRLFDVCKSGAVGDGKTDCTSAFQQTINTCADAGGGVVHVSAGIYRSGMLRLRSGVCLELDAGAEIRAIESLDAFPPTESDLPGNFRFCMRHALLYAEGACGIGLRGQGVVNGMGAAEAFAQTTQKVPDRYQNRPSVIRFVDCHNIRIENVKIQDSAFWTMHLMACTDVVVRGITLKSRSPNYNNDGIDVDSCEDVRISDCVIDSEDDAISIKGTTARPCRRVLVNNCILSSHCNAVRVGAENFKAFEDIYFSNCHIHDSQIGISFQNIDGYPMRRISFVNVSMRRVAIPVHIITHRKTYPVGVPEKDYPIPHGSSPASIEDILFDGISGREIGSYEGIGPVNRLAQMTRLFPCTFSGHPEAPIRNLTIRNVNLHFVGGGTSEDAARIPERINDFPNPGGDPFPVYGLFLRHVQDATVSNVRLNVENGDARPAVLVEHSSRVSFDRLIAKGSKAQKIVRLHDTQLLDFIQCHAMDLSGPKVGISAESGFVEQSSSPFSIE